MDNNAEFYSLLDLLIDTNTNDTANPSGEGYNSDNRQTFDIYKDDIKESYNQSIYSLADEFTQVMAEANSVISHGANTSNNGINFTQEMKRLSKEITDKNDLKEILELTHGVAAQKSTVMDYFGNFGDQPRFQPYYIIKVPAGAYGGYSKINKEIQTSKRTNKSPFTTTVGIWVFNKAFIEPMSDILGYINKPITSKVYKSINQTISYALIEDKITVKQLKDFISQSQIIMSCCSALAPSHTNLIFTMEDQINKKKQELKKKYGDKISNDNPDLDAASKYENELIKYAQDLLKDDPSTDMYDSGARSSWDNNFKNMYLTRGPLKRVDGSFSFSEDSYIEGLNPESYVAVADSSVQGPYSRARKTASGGYIEKLFTSATQHIKVLPKGSDCKTKHYITVTLTDDNIKDWFYSFMINSTGGLTELLPENANKYIGKTVKMRFSALCHSKNGICEACAGTLFNRIGITNIGMASMIMMSSLKNAAMKKFHDSTIKLAHVDGNKLFN